METKSKLIRISVPNATYDSSVEFAKNIDSISETGNPQVSDAAKRVFRAVISYFKNEEFQKCLETEGMDALAYIKWCVNKGMKESLGEKIGR